MRAVQNDEPNNNLKPEKQKQEDPLLEFKEPKKMKKKHKEITTIFIFVCVRLLPPGSMIYSSPIFFHFSMLESLPILS